MQKLITYLKQGNGRGLRTMLIFSVLAILLSWGMNYSSLEQIHATTPFMAISVYWLHFFFILAGLVAIWLLYLAVVGISSLISCIFQLKLNKGLIWRSSMLSVITLFILSMLLTLIAYVLAKFGQTAFQFYPIIIMVLISVLLVTLIAFALAEPKEGKKKK